MHPASASFEPPELRGLLQGEPERLAAWTRPGAQPALALNLACIVVGAGLYGAAMGCWRSPLQALYVALKFPLIILLTTLGNALLNAMLAPLLGLNLSFRQSWLAILLSFGIASAILGSFSPLVAFLVWNAPPMDSGDASRTAYEVIKLTHVAVIAFAGVAATVRLRQLLERLGGSAAVARRVLLAWLAGNLVLGAQLTWNLRPFIGTPLLPVQFLRDNAFESNFFENVARSLAVLSPFD